MRVNALLLAIVSGICSAVNQAYGESVTLQDVVRATAPLPKATIDVAKEVITLNPDPPSASAVAVVGDRILAAGTLEELKAAADKQP